MTPDVVVDVGNSRVKWGRCSATAVVDSAALPHDDSVAWQRQLDSWNLKNSLSWVITGVHPRTRDQLAQWVQSLGGSVRLLTSSKELPLQVHLEHPDRAGIDRLLNAVAANKRRVAGKPAAIVDAGSAVTIDYLDASGTFRGGAILPGLRIMSQALHLHTALLPAVEVREPVPAVPATTTTTAMQAGVFAAVAGGIEKLLRRLRSMPDGPPVVFLTGGDARLIGPALATEITAWPHMTLEGIRLAAEALP
jgi:type III pantothenate kinase